MFSFFSYHFTILHCVTMRSAFTVCIAQLFFIKDRLTYLLLVCILYIQYTVYSTWWHRPESNGFFPLVSHLLWNIKGSCGNIKGSLLCDLPVWQGRLTSRRCPTPERIYALLAPAPRLALHIFWKIHNQGHRSSICTNPTWWFRSNTKHLRSKTAKEKIKKQCKKR